MSIRNCNDLISNLRHMELNPDEYTAVLCGSALVESNPRDIDIFIYTKWDEREFSEKLYRYLLLIYSSAKTNYIAPLQFYSVKYVSSEVNYSIHIVSMKKLLSIIDQASLVDTYTNINVFDVKLYNQTVYRKWIMETEYLTGNGTLKEYLLNELVKRERPTALAKQILSKQIKNNIAYFHEKIGTDRVFCNIILCQIINNLINYCYLANEKYYGTVKYIRSDLIGFDQAVFLCRLTIELIEKINIKKIYEFSEIIDQIPDILE